MKILRCIMVDLQIIKCRETTFTYLISNTEVHDEVISNRACVQINTVKPS